MKRDKYSLTEVERLFHQSLASLIGQFCPVDVESPWLISLKLQHFQRGLSISILLPMLGKHQDCLGTQLPLHYIQKYTIATRSSDMRPLMYIRGWGCLFFFRSSMRNGLNDAKMTL